MASNSAVLASRGLGLKLQLFTRIVMLVVTAVGAGRGRQPLVAGLSREARVVPELPR